jgi:TRAP transporter TAXI family solute receptor
MALLLLGVQHPTSNATTAIDLGLITGPEQGTYHHLGMDLKKLVTSAGINLRVQTSKGSVDNLFAVYQHKAQMGIVQSDVLTFVAEAQSKPVLRRIVEKTRMVFPLHDEEIHLVARRGISEFEQLAGKRVAIGREGSGSYLTARLLFKLSEVAPSATATIEMNQALPELKAGRIDAMLYVAGYPIRVLKNDVTAADGLALVPIASKRILEEYLPAEIPANVYGWQTTPVSTVAVKAVLVSFDSRDQQCDSVGRFARAVASGMDWLTKHGHPKWKTVDLDFPLKGWEQYDCVRNYLGR